MKYRTHTYYTDAQKALTWERWKQGWTPADSSARPRCRTNRSAQDVARAVEVLYRLL